MMTDTERRRPSGRRLPCHVRVYLVGAFILISGLAGSALIYVTAVTAPAEKATDLAPVAVHTKQYELQLESIGGRAAFLAVELTRWLEGLWHGRLLAYMVAILCTTIAIVCFLVAHGLSADLPRDPAARRD